ncbi:hypothetical protein [Bosea sp. 124]|uniref:hypothetical protein n=1 Tax=Bosea sp. 124 TaxID=2135642 RepID=UPI000D416345|nr:hypothetical protein [Bosea sp. 124]PTM41764.1 hypothetical protein C8D03_3337 [Bosea sp. 124]
MSGWFVLCALSGLVLGLRWPVQVLIAAAMIALPAGFIYQMRFGFDVALLMGVGGVIILQVGYIITSLTVALLGHSVSVPVGMLRARFKL